MGLDHMANYGHREGTPDAATRMGTIWKLVEAGYERQLLLSHDFWISVGVFTSDQMADLQAGNPDGYSFIPLRVLPRLRELGVSEAQITTLTVDNPRDASTPTSAGRMTVPASNTSSPGCTSSPAGRTLEPCGKSNLIAISSRFCPD